MLVEEDLYFNYKEKRIEQFKKMSKIDKKIKFMKCRYYNKGTEVLISH